MTEFLSKEQVIQQCQCKDTLIGITAFPKGRQDNPIAICYSETIGKSGYVDIFGVMLVKVATKLTDVSMCNLHITAIDSETGDYIDPIKDNIAAVRLLLHTGVTVVRIKTEDGEIKYNKTALYDLLDK